MHEESKFQVWIDLEQTIIDDFETGRLMNASRIREFLIERSIKSIGIFSFAMYGPIEAKEFVSRHKWAVERALDVSIHSWPCVEEMMEVDTELTDIDFDAPWDYVDIRGKVGAFTNWCGYHKISHGILIDDRVPNLDLCLRDTGDTIRFYDVRTI